MEVNFYVGTERGPTYIDPNRSQNILLGFNQKLTSFGLGVLLQNILYLYACFFFIDLNRWKSILNHH